MEDSFINRSYFLLTCLSPSTKTLALRRKWYGVPFGIGRHLVEWNVFLRLILHRISINFLGVMVLSDVEIKCDQKTGMLKVAQFRVVYADITHAWLKADRIDDVALYQQQYVTAKG